MEGVYGARDAAKGAEKCNDEADDAPHVGESVGPVQRTEGAVQRTRRHLPRRQRHLACRAPGGTESRARLVLELEEEEEEEEAPPYPPPLAPVRRRKRRARRRRHCRRQTALHPQRPGPPMPPVAWPMPPASVAGRLRAVQHPADELAAVQGQGDAGCAAQPPVVAAGTPARLPEADAAGALRGAARADGALALHPSTGEALPPPSPRRPAPLTRLARRRVHRHGGLPGAPGEPEPSPGPDARDAPPSDHDEPPAWPAEAPWPDLDAPPPPEDEDAPPR